MFFLHLGIELRCDLALCRGLVPRRWAEVLHLVTELRCAPALCRGGAPQHCAEGLHLGRELRFFISA
nr:hypothetical protein Iba_chr10aCG12550 [Ipomoea batatas]